VSAYHLHQAGDCDPFSCPVCEQECHACGQWLTHCVCPTLPIDQGPHPFQRDKPAQNPLCAVCGLRRHDEESEHIA
jgi:hypothetical protein